MPAPGRADGSTDNVTSPTTTRPPPAVDPGLIGYGLFACEQGAIGNVCGKTALANLEPIASLLSKKTRNHLAKAGTSPVQSKVTSKDAGLTQYRPNSFRLQRYESGPRKQVDVYSIAPGARQRFTAGGMLALLTRMRRGWKVRRCGPDDGT